MRSRESCQRRSSRVQSKRCTAYIDRTVNTVRRAAESWAYCYDEPLPLFALPRHPDQSCSDFSKSVKIFLSSEVSDDWSAQMSFQSLKKLLPDSCRCMEATLLDELQSRLTSPPLALPRGFSQFVKREVLRLFPKGWDLGSYEAFCLTSSPPLSATSDSPRSEGGALAALSPLQHSSFLDAVLRGNTQAFQSEALAKLSVVQSAGKPRPLSSFDSSCFLLKPLHKSIYSRLSKKSWLLRGSPRPSSFDRCGFQEGGLLVSGDYASATDFLSLEVAELCLDSILSTSASVPAEIASFARRVLRPRMVEVDSSGLVVRDFVPTRGQQMGSYLSFPLLCLQNYLAFRWALKTRGVEDRVPCLINGDDILFQTSDVGFFDHWVSTVERLGLQVERTKTSRDFRYGSLNSTLLGWKDGKLRVVPSLRFGMLRRPDCPSSLGVSFSDFLRGIEDPFLRFRAGKVFFSWHIGMLSQLPVGLPSVGFRGTLVNRLQQIFGLGRLAPGEIPAFPRRHDVVLPSDFVSEVDVSAVDSELRFFSSAETACWKWASGWQPACFERSSIRWCLKVSSLRSAERDVVPLLSGALSSDSRFSFFLRNLRSADAWPGVSRSQYARRLLDPLPSKKVERLFLPLEPFSFDLGRGVLPQYREFGGEVDMGTVLVR